MLFTAALLPLLIFIATLMLRVFMLAADATPLPLSPPFSLLRLFSAAAGATPCHVTLLIRCYAALSASSPPLILQKVARDWRRYYAATCFAMPR